ncbi:MAG TPA: hypothetical protein VGF99_16220, partial [Myxococcota bacterium]
MDPQVRLFLLELTDRGALSGEQAGRIESLATTGADPEALVRAAGVDDETWLSAAAAAFGLPPAPRSGLLLDAVDSQREALRARHVPLERDLWQRLNAAPFVVGDNLFVAFSRGASTASPELASLPAHRAVLAPPARLVPFRNALLAAESAPPRALPSLSSLPSMPAVTTVSDALESGGWLTAASKSLEALPPPPPLQARMTPSPSSPSSASSASSKSAPLPPLPPLPPTTPGANAEQSFERLDVGALAPKPPALLGFPLDSVSAAPTSNPFSAVESSLPNAAAPSTSSSSSSSLSSLSTLPKMPTSADAERTVAVQTGRLPAFTAPTSLEAERTTAVQTGRITTLPAALLSPVSNEAERTVAVITGSMPAVDFGAPHSLSADRTSPGPFAAPRATPSSPSSSSVPSSSSSTPPRAPTPAASTAILGTLPASSIVLAPALTPPPSFHGAAQNAPVTVEAERTLAVQTGQLAALAPIALSGPGTSEVIVGTALATGAAPAAPAP